MRRLGLLVLSLLITIALIPSLTSCTHISQDKTVAKSVVNEKAKAGSVPDTDRLRTLKEDTAAGDHIMIRVSPSKSTGGNKKNPKSLPLIMAIEKTPNQDEVLRWFAPLAATKDSQSPASDFYPTGSHWYLVDAQGVKRGKVSIDKFGSINYLRIGGGDENQPAQFKFADGESLVKGFIKTHGGLPEDKLIIKTQGFRESASNTHIAVSFQMGFGHQFGGIDIYDDSIEVGISKLFGAHYMRRWHKFKKYGKTKPFLDPGKVAESIVRKYRKTWKDEPDKYRDLLSGKQIVNIDLEQLVYFDPRPRDPSQFNSKKVIYHPGWL
ncbi:MAG TPA: hypothetical protein VE439_08285, partial [Anaerolineae bacterium]|nr:hypothetical protein [Anaerolineae bacterium]